MASLSVCFDGLSHLLRTDGCTFKSTARCCHNRCVLKPNQYFNESLLPLRPANQTTEVPEIHLAAQLHSYKDETSISQGDLKEWYNLSILIFLFSSLLVAEGCHWWSAPLSPGTCATRCCRRTSRTSWSVWPTSPWPTSYVSSVASVSNAHDSHIPSLFWTGERKRSGISASVSLICQLHTASEDGKSIKCSHVVACRSFSPGAVTRSLSLTRRQRRRL